MLQYLHTLPKPTIAAVNGDALAGGAGLMAACDLAVAAATARIGYPEVKRGLVPSIVMHDLSRQVGDRRARQLLLSGEPISAEVAVAWGMVNLVTPAESCLAEAIRLAQELSSIGARGDRDHEAAARRSSGQAARSSRRGRGERGRPGIGRGPRGNPCVRREAAAAWAQQGPALRNDLARGLIEPCRSERRLEPGRTSAWIKDRHSAPWVSGETVGSVLDRTAELYPAGRPGLSAPQAALVVARARTSG